MTVRFYSSVAAETTLATSITNVSTSATLGSTTGLPSSFPFTLAMDYEGTSEELVTVTAMAGTTVTITRAFNGTSATSHAAGARVRHVSCAQDFTDSRTHENSSMGVHGLGASSSVVGTLETQTLSNKTLDDATGTLERIDIFNVGAGWETSINGDAANPNENLLVGRPTPVANNVFELTTDGRISIINKDAAADAAINAVKFRTMKSDGTTAVLAMTEGGQVSVKLQDGGAVGFTVLAPTDAGDVPVFQGADATGSNRRTAIWADGRETITGTNASSIQLNVAAAASQSASIQRWTDNLLNQYGQVASNGSLSWGSTGISSTGPITATGGITIAGEPVTSGAWNTYTPAWTSTGTAPSVGNGVIQGRYAIVGRTVHCHINFTPGSTSTFGTNFYSFSLPVAAANQGASMVGQAHILQSGGGRWAGQIIVGPGATAMSPFFPTTGTPAQVQGMTNVIPVTFANGDALRMTFMYEAAS